MSNTYLATYLGPESEFIEADTLYEAKQKAVALFKAPKSKQSLVAVTLVCKGDEPVTVFPDSAYF